jgi:glycosyltransferase involved in cell wall biosynthesis
MPRRLYIDLTTAFEERHRIPHGTIRVERSLVGALVARGASEVAFCRFNAPTQRFVLMAPDEVRATVTTQAVAEARRDVPAVPIKAAPSRLRRAGLAVEHFVRREIRGRFRRARGAVVRQTISPGEIFEPGAWLLLPGELQRHSFAHLMALKRSHDLHLAFVFYDLLDTLAATDPRASDPAATDIPSTEFIMREADLILPISQFSAGRLRQHAIERGRRLPPMTVIRLGHELPAPASSAAAVPGLEPNAFALSVGDVVGRKNHHFLAQVWASLARERATMMPLVIVGRTGRDGQQIVETILADPDAARTVRFISNADDAALDWLYRNCAFTLFPSLDEGFGLPVVESLAHGKPCIASNAAAIPEASQGAALHLDPTDAAGWRNAIAPLLDDPAEIARLSAEISANFRPVGWANTAAETLKALQAAAATS